MFLKFEKRKKWKKSNWFVGISKFYAIFLKTISKSLKWLNIVFEFFQWTSEKKGNNFILNG